MTAEQVAAIKIGDHVALRDLSGVVTRTAPMWFMVTWEGGNVEIIKRRSSILTGRLELHA